MMADNTPFFFLAAYFALIVVAAIGWVLNVVKLFGFTETGLSGNEVEVIIRVVGIFAAPLGAIVGWF
jgi:hypothetical protein